jgi:hypothetical protein
MSSLDALTPTNLLQEKERFLANPDYNPQFTYLEDIPAESLSKYGHPKPAYLELAQEILDQAYFGRNEQDILMTEGKKMTQAEVTEKCQLFLEMHGLENRYQIIWSSSFVSRATTSENALKLRTNSVFYKDGLIGMIYHELGTHAIRRVNYEQQSWFKKKKEAGITTNYLRTEEGLAILHALIPHQFKSVYSAAIRYVAAEYALHHNFSQLWQFVGKYIQDPETRWMIVSRLKRGVSDTSQPLAFTKDIVYFEGAVDTWQWLDTHDYNLPPLYLGKIAFQDVEAAVTNSPGFTPLLPSFYSLNPEQYAQDLLEIGAFNKFHQLQ